ncbi:polyadenylate-binding protein 2-like [Zingiber officinale]|uniref:polyadenylate-binding protein 2-like n=1 Tax=Zingiber officinale TaxID=94328 RepID=UPI001C4AD0BA|nr:polyadenylate-binding protein 2-like [Zingiber officinale]XP_042431971.1 polyadenylate-binding protein 2-like [Zingiber officinale]
MLPRSRTLPARIHDSVNDENRNQRSYLQVEAQPKIDEDTESLNPGKYNSKCFDDDGRLKHGRLKRTEPSGPATNQSSKEEADSCLIFVGNVDYACTPEEVQQHFQSCGTVNRVTILTDRNGQPKGFAYVEFLEVEAVQEAFWLHESKLHGRPIKVATKQTNVPGLKQFHPLQHNPYPMYSYSRPHMPS